MSHVSLILDATAGNQHMWGGRSSPLVVFLDVESGLKVPPDIIADNRCLPFRNKVFTCVIYDPPWIPYILSKHNDPTEEMSTFWGTPGKKNRDLFVMIHKAQKEFKRVTSRLCVKWGDYKVSRWKILPFFKGWKLVHELVYKSQYGQGRSKTYWWTFVLEDKRKEGSG